MNDLKTFEQQVKDGDKFEFGKNWRAYLKTLNEEKIQVAITSLKNFLVTAQASNQQFIDVGSGSGLFSLAAKRIGFQVTSFDFDRQSVECTRLVKDTYFPHDANWNVLHGSVLDEDFLNTLGQFDVVYSWGVLHHTGNMWSALSNVTRLVKPGGQLFIAIYNQQGFRSSYWHFIKKCYNKNSVLKYFILAFYLPFFMLSYFVLDLLHLNNPFKRYIEYKQKRGMNLYHDWIDWLGGYPFEVATANELIAFYTGKGFRVATLQKTNRLGCNQIVFIKES